MEKPNLGGRPPKYKTPEEMEIKINAYFDQCVTEYLRNGDGEIETTKSGPIILNLNAPSLAGLALFLGFADRRSIYDNEGRDGFSHVIKTARSKVEEWVYQHSLDGSVPPAVGIFILKQFGYTDRQEVAHTGQVQIIDDIS